MVSLRDGAYSRFDRSNVVEEFTPTQGLKVKIQKLTKEILYNGLYWDFFCKLQSIIQNVLLLIYMICMITVHCYSLHNYTRDVF